MLALVATVELVISSRRLDFTTIWADDWRQAGHAASRVATKRDVLCFGDSLVKFGVLPKVIRAKSGLSAHNLAVNAGTVPSTYILLKRALESGARPKAVVVDFFALMQPDQPRKSTRMYPELATPRECLELARVSGDPGFFEASVMGMILPSYRCRFEVRDSVKAALEGRRASPWPAQASIWESWKTQGGAQFMPPSPRPPADLALVNDISPADWHCDAINAAYVEKFLALAKLHQVPVFWLIPPISPEVQACRDARGTDAHYDRFARATLSRHPEVTVIDARRLSFDGTAYFDPLHLNGVGATALSEALADRLVDGLAGRDRNERWVDIRGPANHAEGVARAGEKASGLR
jgi:lysophospholipase L1-like esterase